MWTLATAVARARTASHIAARRLDLIRDRARRLYRDRVRHDVRGQRRRVWDNRCRAAIARISEVLRPCGIVLLAYDAPDPIRMRDELAPLVARRLDQGSRPQKRLRWILCHHESAGAPIRSGCCDTRRSKAMPPASRSRNQLSDPQTCKCRVGLPQRGKEHLSDLHAQQNPRLGRSVYGLSLREAPANSWTCFPHDRIQSIGTSSRLRSLGSSGNGIRRPP